MKLTERNFALDDRRRFVIDSGLEWLDPGVHVTDGSAVADDDTVTVDDVTVANNKIYLFVSGGTVNTTFTVTVTMTDSVGEVKNDTLVFNCVDP